MANFKNLVFKGGGVLGIAYAGAIKVIEEKNILSQAERVAGTSAGAITAALVALKYSAAEIYQIVQSTDFKSFEDHENPLRIATKYGLYEGQTFLSWMIDKVTRKGLPANAAFSDLKAKGFLDLHVFATDLNTKSLKRFSYADSPNVSVAEAVRASMSIPLFFEAWQFTNSIPDNHIYVDGGMIYNYPITVFDSNGTPNSETLGFYLLNKNPTVQDSGLAFNHIGHYVKTVFDTIMDAQVVNFLNDSSQMKRSVVIDNLGISATNFNLTDAQKNQLYQSGISNTQDYLSKILVPGTA